MIQGISWYESVSYSLLMLVCVPDDNGLPVRRVQPASVAGCCKFSAPSHTAVNSGGGQTALPSWAEFLPPPPEHPPPSATGSDNNPSSRLLVPVSVI
jgi:hypothetical protein